MIPPERLAELAEFYDQFQHPSNHYLQNAPKPGEPLRNCYRGYTRPTHPTLHSTVFVEGN